MPRRLLRHSFPLLSGLSLLMCVAACGPWVRSYGQAITGAPA